MVLATDGRFQDADGSSEGISNREDRAMLGYLRSQSDFIVTSAFTARRENYRNSKYAPIVLFTNGKTPLQDIPALTDAGAFPATLFYGPASNAAGLDLANVPDQSRVPLVADKNLFKQIEGHFEALPHSKFLFEGGPASLKELLLSKLTVRFFLTISGGQHLSTPEALAILASQIDTECTFTEVATIRTEQNLFIALDLER